MLDTRNFDIPRFLSVLPLFSDLNPTEIERLAGGCTLRRIERGEMVFRMGEPCESFHVVVVGQVKLFVISPAGAEKVIELIGAGGSFADYRKAFEGLGYGIKGPQSPRLAPAPVPNVQSTLSRRLRAERGSRTLPLVG